MHGAAGHTSSLYFNNNNNNIDDKTDIKFGTFNPQIQSSNLRRSSTTDNAEQSTNAHLIDHNYATSSFDECFGDSWKGNNQKNMQYKIEQF